MTYRVHHVNKRTGVTYVYEATSYWDKEKNQPRNKQVCIGKLDPCQRRVKFDPSVPV
ncbi:MAG: Transposase IS4 family protein [Synergistales bacterium 54_24]|nr:MAG: Transposase IS4 family protein [Synergistales bacterium 54_24]